MQTEHLIVSGLCQLLASCLMGWGMLIPRQPWGASGRKWVKNPRMLRAAHTDLLMLALMQLAIGSGCIAMELAPGAWVIVALMFGGWTNAMPYFVSGVSSLNPFSLSGPPAQLVLSAIGGLSSLAITVALIALCAQGWTAL